MVYLIQTIALIIITFIIILDFTERLYSFFKYLFARILKYYKNPITLLKKIKIFFLDFSTQKYRKFLYYKENKSKFKILTRNKKLLISADRITILIGIEKQNLKSFFNLFNNLLALKKFYYILSFTKKPNFFFRFLIKFFLYQNRFDVLINNKDFYHIILDKKMALDYLFYFDNNFLFKSNLFFNIKKFKYGLFYFDTIDVLARSHFFKPQFLKEYFYSFNYIGPNYLLSKHFIEYIFNKFRSFDLQLLYFYILYYSQHYPNFIQKADIPIFSSYKYDYKNTLNSFRQLQEFSKLSGSIRELRYFKHGNKYKLSTNCKSEPLVSIIIPTKNAYNFIKPCIDSILKKTKYLKYEIVIVDNGSSCLKCVNFLKRLKKNENIKVLDYPIDYNYSKLNNYGFKHSNGTFVILLNNDTKIISPNWIQDLLNFAVDDSIGCVGPRLLFPDNTIQHTGTFVGIGTADHAFRLMNESENLYNYRGNNIGNYSSITAACLMVSRKLYNKVGGFNETDVKIAFSDVDFCLKIKELGYRNVINPYVKVFHFETATRSKDIDGKDRARLIKESNYIHRKWKKYILEDPCYNKNLTKMHTDSRLDNKTNIYVKYF